MNVKINLIIINKDLSLRLVPLLPEYQQYEHGHQLTLHISRPFFDRIIHLLNHNDRIAIFGLLMASGVNIFILYFLRDMNLLIIVEG